MTTDRHDPDAAPGLQDEFWGEHTEWTPHPQPDVERRSLGSMVGRWFDAILGGGAVAGRAHGKAGVRTALDEPVEDRIVDQRIEQPRRTGDVDGELVDDAWTDDQWTDDEWTDDECGQDAWTFEADPQRPRHPGVDPLLARLGGLAVILTLAAPLVVGFTGSGSGEPSADALATVSDTAAAELADPTMPTPTESPAPDGDLATTAPPATPAGSSAGAATTTPPTLTTAAEGDTESDTTAPSTVVAAALEDAPSASAAATTVTCGSRYELAAGDYWIRIADAAGVSLAELLDVNDATIDTVLVPGASICLPAGAATPAPPTTTAPAPAPTAPAAPATTSAPSRPTTTAAPPAPTTTAAPRPTAVSQSQAVAIIRDVWPDELEEHAIEIARRESTLQSNVNNWCCYGLFQIHWEAHRSWLATIGVTSVSQLYDPRVNATAAYTLYQRAGGFGPWGG